jgi:hypothetical protein
MIAEQPHEAPRFSSDLNRSQEVFGIAQMADGGLIVTLASDFDFPSGEGVARLDRDGHVVWYRHSYATHWPYVAGNRILVASGTIQARELALKLTPRVKLNLPCGSKYLNDKITVLDFNGRDLADVSVLDALLNSPYRAVLVQDNPDAKGRSICDLLHVKFVRPVGAELASHLTNVSPDDFLVSMRNVSAFAIIGARDGKLKDLYTGSFRQQHSVQPFRGSSVLIFDDNGTTANEPPSRVLTYDLLTGAERDLFDSRAVPDGSFHPMFEGVLDLSPDRRYLLITSTFAGDAFELRLSDLRVVTHLYNLQSTKLASASDLNSWLPAGLRTTNGMYYVH